MQSGSVRTRTSHLVIYTRFGDQSSVRVVIVDSLRSETDLPLYGTSALSRGQAHNGYAEDFPTAFDDEAKVVDGQEWDAHCRSVLVTQSVLLAGMMVGNGSPLPKDRCLERYRTWQGRSPAQDVAQLEDRIITALSGRGLLLKRLVGDGDELPVDLRFLDLLLRASGDPSGQLRTGGEGWLWDPDAETSCTVQPQEAMEIAGAGRPVKLLQDERQSEHPWRQNYTTLAGLADEVVAVLEDQVSKRQVLSFTGAEGVAKYPDFVLASLGANRKDKPNGVVTARVFAGWGNWPRCQYPHADQRAREVSDRVGFEAGREGKGRPAAAHVRAHSRCERGAPAGAQSSRLEVLRPGAQFPRPGLPASYYWSRVAGAIGRLAQYLAGLSSATWHMVVADDFHVEAGGQDYKFALHFLLHFVRSRRTTVVMGYDGRGGEGEGRERRRGREGGRRRRGEGREDTVTWVAYEILHRARQLRISQRRADWFMKWTSEIAASRTAH